MEHWAHDIISILKQANNNNKIVFLSDFSGLDATNVSSDTVPGQACGVSKTNSIMHIYVGSFHCSRDMDYAVCRPIWCPEAICVPSFGHTVSANL